MSINQMQPFLKEAPSLRPADGDRFMYVWVYGNYFNWEAITRQLGANMLGVGALKNWTWHINQLGQPNIRRNYMADMQGTVRPPYLTPAPATYMSPWNDNTDLSFGWTLQVLQSHDKLVDEVLGQKRIRMIQNIKTIVSTKPHRAIDVPAIVYWDPLHTCNLMKDLMVDERERYRWVSGLLWLETAGVPRYFIQKAEMHLLGQPVDVEPLLVRPDQLRLMARVIQHERSKDDVEARGNAPTPQKAANAQEARPLNGGRGYRPETRPATFIAKGGQIGKIRKGGRFVIVIKGIAVREDRARIYQRQGSATKMQRANHCMDSAFFDAEVL